MPELGTDQVAKDELRNVLCKRLGASPTTATAGDHKPRNKTVVEGGTVLYTVNLFEARLKPILDEVPGVDKWLGGSITLSREETNRLRVVADDVTVVAEQRMSDSEYARKAGRKARPGRRARPPGAWWPPRRAGLTRVAVRERENERLQSRSIVALSCLSG